VCHKINILAFGLATLSVCILSPSPRKRADYLSWTLGYGTVGHFIVCSCDRDFLPASEFMHLIQFESLQLVFWAFGVRTCVVCRFYSLLGKNLVNVKIVMPPTRADFWKQGILLFSGNFSRVYVLFSASENCHTLHKMLLICFQCYEILTWLH